MGVLFAAGAALRYFIRRQHVPECSICARYAPGDFFPPHDASPRCESGRHNHCTCDTCF